MGILERIDLVCKEKGISRRQVGMGCGVDPSTIAKWKIKTPTIDNLKRVADYLEVSVDWLSGKSDVRKNEQQLYYTDDETESEAQSLTDDQRALMKAIPTMPASQVKALRVIMEEMKGTNPDG